MKKLEKIKIVEKKKLKLINVLTKELRNIELENLDEEIKKFVNFLEVTKIQTKGPLITRSMGTKVSDIGEITVDYDVMIQTIRKINFKDFTFHDVITVSNCLYTHYEGTQEEFSYAQTKMGLYIWENDLIDLGEEYTIYIENDEHWLSADVFKPMEIFNETI